MMNKKYLLPLILLVAGISFVLIFKIDFLYRNGHEGLYVLKGDSGKWLLLTDDLYASESSLLLYSFNFPEYKKVEHSSVCLPVDKPCYYYEWNKKSGRGFIKTYYPDGKKHIISFGRYLSSTGKDVSGLFVGGGLPVTDPDYNKDNNNETGMTYFDGNNFFHIWCNVNEGIEDSSGNSLLPSTWQFLSSQVYESSENDLTINSKHQINIDGVPIIFDRTMFYNTGKTYFTFNTNLKNIGDKTVTFKYVYGDEPWLGNYYKFSKGNVGWYKDGLVFTEYNVDPKKYNYIGMFDYGNQLAGESHTFTNKANFIEWSPKTRPDEAYFANRFGGATDNSANIPLDSYKMRLLALEWNKIILKPGETFNFILHIGMAQNNPKTNMPVKPIIEEQ